MANVRKDREWRDYLIITVAMVLGSVGLGVFLLPNHITMGGVGGIASILYWGFGIPVSASYLVLNIFLLIFALRILGWRFCAKTIYAVIVFSVSLSVVERMAAGTALLSDQPFMAVVVGAFFLGCSSGLGLSVNASTGGSDTVAAMVHKYYDLSLGNIILLCDMVIVTSSYLVLRDWEKVIYGYVLLFIMSLFVDKVVNMMRRSVQFCIITEKYQEMSHAINEQARRGCTIFEGVGTHTGEPVRMLFVLARQKESSMIFSIINEIDPHAFVSQSAVIGVYGLGFDPFKRKRHNKVKSLE
ncbi:MAG: YitT family protein [Prevotella sp.]|nr:YitT family protein [Prevotella sp.]